MIYLDIVYPDVGRSYRTDSDTVVGCRVEGDVRWCVPVSLHYHFALLDTMVVGRYVTRARRSIRWTRHEPPMNAVTVPTAEDTARTRLVYAPESDDAVSSPTGRPTAPHTRLSSRPPSTPTLTLTSTVVLDDHYTVPVPPSLPPRTHVFTNPKTPDGCRSRGHRVRLQRYRVHHHRQARPPTTNIRKYVHTTTTMTVKTMTPTTMTMTRQPLCWFRPPVSPYQPSRSL